jgi:hypothetical protein
MATTQAIIGAIKAAGLTISKTVKVRSSQPCTRGEIVTTSKETLPGYAVVSMPRGGFAVNYVGAGDAFDAKITEVASVLRSRGFDVRDQKAFGMAIVVF